MNVKSVFLAVALALSISSAGTAAADPARPTISVCLKARSQMASVPRSVYTVEIQWNGFEWQPGERVDIGIWDSTGEVWPQLRDNRYRPGREVTYEDIVVGDSSIYPLYFSIIHVSENLARLSDLECQRGFCSIPGDMDGLREVSVRRIPITTAGGGRNCGQR